MSGWQPVGRDAAPKMIGSLVKIMKETLDEDQAKIAESMLKTNLADGTWVLLIRTVDGQEQRFIGTAQTAAAIMEPAGHA